MKEKEIKLKLTPYEVGFIFCLLKDHQVSLMQEIDGGNYDNYYLNIVHGEIEKILHKIHHQL